MVAERVEPPRGGADTDLDARYRAALALRDEQRRRPAIALLTEIVETAPDWFEPRLELAVLLGDKKHLGQAAAQLRALFHAAPRHPRVLELIEAVVEKRWMDPQVEPLVEFVTDRGGGSEMVWLSRLFAAVKRSDDSAAARAADALMAKAQTPRIRLLAARLLARTGDEALARTWARAMLDQARQDPRGRGVEALEEFLAGLDAGEGEPYRGSGNVIIQRTPGANTTIVVFTALNLEPAIQRRRLYGLAALLGANLVTLSDAHRLLYLTGLEPLGRDFAETTEGLRSVCRELGAPRLVFMGNSGGSFAALRYGLDIPEVDQVLLTGPVTILDPSHPVMARPRVKPILERLAEEAPDKMENLRPRLERREPPLCVVAYYGELHGKDAIHAANLAGVPGVTLCPLHTDAHEVANALMEAGTFPHVLAGLVKGTLTPDRARKLARLPG